ncbi:MAG: serine hydrolase [bacterium]|nr:serine hydrolase [bacterium]
MTDEGIFAAGAQLAVVVSGDAVVNVGVGEAGCGADMTADALHNVYCIVKPMTYLLLGYALESGGFGPDDLLDEIVDLPAWVPEGLTYRILAAHEADLAEPSAFVWRSTPAEQRQDLLSLMSGNLGAGYSELCGGLVVEHIIEELSGQPPCQYCKDELLEPLGLSGEIFIDPDLAMAARSRIRVPVIGLPVDPLPMLTEFLPSRIREARLAMGAYATMGGVARLFEAVGEVMAGNSQPGFPSPALLTNLLDDGRPLRHDPVLLRPAKWAAGLMTDVDLQGISKAVGPGTVGHTAGLANSFAFHDPSRKASLAVYLNGVGIDDDDHILPRQKLLDEILNAIPVI